VTYSATRVELQCTRKAALQAPRFGLAFDDVAVQWGY